MVRRPCAAAITRAGSSWCLRAQRSHVSATRVVDDPLSVGRDMREPVVEAVVGDLLLTAPVRAHPPDLHPSGARRVEVDVFAVGRVLRPIVQTACGGQTDFVATADRNLANVELVVSLADVDEPPP